MLREPDALTRCRKEASDRGRAKSIRAFRLSRGPRPRDRRDRRRQRESHQPSLRRQSRALPRLPRRLCADAPRDARAVSYPARSVEELRVRLELLIDHLLQEHLNASEVVTILLRDIDESDLWGKDLEAKLFSFTTKLAGFFADARAFLREDVEPLAVASLIYLAFSGLVQVSAHVERMSGIRLRDAEVPQTHRATNTPSFSTAFCAARRIRECRDTTRAHPVRLRGAARAS